MRPRVRVPTGGPAPPGCERRWEERASAHGCESSRVERRRERAPPGASVVGRSFASGCECAHGCEFRREDLRLRAVSVDGRSVRAPTGARAHGWSIDGSERRRVRQPTLKGASADGRSAPPCGVPTFRNECPLLARCNTSVKAPTGSARPRERPPMGGSAQVQRVSSAPRKRKARQHQTAKVPPGHSRFPRGLANYSLKLKS